MTLQDVKDRVKEIRRNKDNDEGAHSLEDALYKDVLKAIAKEKIPALTASILAKEALKASRIKFHRWTA